MGLFSFAKHVGEKIFGASDAHAAPADALVKEAAKHGLPTDGIKVIVNGDKVEVSGSAPSTADAEKIILAMGNTMGVSEIANNLIVTKEAPAAVMYTVKSGDTLWKIAETNYGKGRGDEYETIFEANKPMLKHPDKIYPGQVLRIPPMQA
jgi:nucleoid-associated protein YgaU